MNMEDKDIKIKFINIKGNKILLSDITDLVPTIYIKENYYSEDNIKYYLSTYLNVNIINLIDLGNYYFSFEIDNEVLNYSYKDLSLIKDDELLKIINNN